ncbi:glutathione-dependent reductase [Oleiphilus sp. HI0071]|uniref:glutathione S-transferase family protein n=1 Tax=unclassified Oleiphilus TaxID=2631174 RepID=UPI0007C39036|nr:MULTISPECIES: glutathione S-transferase family protein [unclassified Oleiphilus]KZY74902.1 glutathione-dependent reductase [Oleiphilus sp. HI0065]KZY82015.1 glutathione-dependent reductase [Oleiphilus sp. HI0071]KZY91145.1 glutathione-dependent reductase [Oleiphilus sp. HI0073]KZZ42167.1 glutathione-dependent reductase [Oleiphilus sp. HI0118]KZZ60386.1 glutathione-dependent reductase [Oleiphilus sp. HI0122]KZZ64810.1 glutathione-dependent reductase [Oleiphilus sp. HI0130]KZZ81972.1 glutat
MGLLVEGKWQTDWYDTKSTGGKFVRKDSSFRNWVTPDGSAGPSGSGGFEAEAGRYHLYVSYACPWAHRTLIFRELKGLQDMVTVSAVNAFMGEEGWTFYPGEGVIPDSVNAKQRMYEIYTLAQHDYTGRVTVPVLWDKKQHTIVSNESAEIIRMFNRAFDHIGAKPGDYYPEPLTAQIDEVNALVYDHVNNGVYKAGFATTQSAYEEAVEDVFRVLDQLEARLTEQRYLVGSDITEADWRLFTTLIRFDAVYVGHFKCNLKRIADYRALSHYVRDLYQQPGVAGTVNMDVIKAHYYVSHKNINPTGIVPAGPSIDFDKAHNRSALT